jgi:DNA-binding response OmpR family regulator
MDKGMAAGANAYLTKPFATRELIDAVARLLAAPASKSSDSRRQSSE